MMPEFRLQGACEPVAEHAEFEELCALFPTGELSLEEEVRLKEHLDECSECRHFLDEVVGGASAMLAELASSNPIEEGNCAQFKEDSAKKRLIRSIDKEQKHFHPRHGRFEPAPAELPGSAPSLRSSGSLRTYLPYAAAFLMGVGLSVLMYWIGPRKLSDQFRSSADLAENDAASSRQKAVALSQHEAERTNRLQAALRKVAELEAANGQLQKQISGLDVGATSMGREKKELLTANQGLAKNVADLESSIVQIRAELEATHSREGQESLRAADSERRIEQLSASLQEQKHRIEEQDATIAEDQDLLAHDRDIRDLMGARQLYVAEVYDSDETGRPKKPYARVFYTKEKSLIFYGFDLDQQPGLRSASAFQVWGKIGSNRANALNLGILYHDSATNKRWSLKIDDPMKLEKIEAIFVTVEPKGGSSQPTTKPMLFAYLRLDPNHP